jgi:aspartokinase
VEKRKINVIKGGGAAIVDSEHIRMFSDYIYSLLIGNVTIILVLSAVKGVTRLLVSIFEAKEAKNEHSMRGRLQDFYLIHTKIILDLFPENKRVLKSFESLFGELVDLVLSKDKYEKGKMYASILQYGELASSMIVSLYLKSIKVDNTLVDIRGYIKTTTAEGETLIHPKSRTLIMNGFPKLFKFKKKPEILITQGFIACDYESGYNTVLSFDGSDTSAAFIAHSMKANKIFFLKDVCGICVGDNITPPNDICNFYHNMTYGGYLRKFSKKTKYPVHPDAIKILRVRKIHTRICSFNYPHLYGTEIKR